MYTPEQLLSGHVAGAVKELFNAVIDPLSVTFQKTNPQFEGDITLVVFPYTKLAGKSPEQTAQVIGEYLQRNVPEVAAFNVVKGFLNVVISSTYWIDSFIHLKQDETWGRQNVVMGAPFVMVEYSSPNTNKPLHLGHMRNILLGYSVAEILKAAGNEVMKVNLVNDRGIHICKSMLAWQKWGNKETPESSGMKGDLLVGKYYVKFDQWYKAELAYAEQTAWETLKKIKQHKAIQIFKDITPEDVAFIVTLIVSLVSKLFESYKEVPSISDLPAPSGDEIDKALEKGSSRSAMFRDYKRHKSADEAFSESGKYSLSEEDKKSFEGLLDTIKNQLDPIRLAQDMLRKWEANDPDIRALWHTMNSWVYEGFAKTYAKLNVDFDKMYYESNTYLLGKEIVEEGLKKNVFQKRPDGAVIIDNTDSGLDVKVVLRSDGTSVYITQDLGTAAERHKEFPFDKHVYVVGNEQDYHFKTLKVSLKKLGYAWADGLYHLSYGMVELPEGKMKSREGTVVDADDLITSMENDAREMAAEKGLIENMSKEEQDQLSHMVGMAALKYFILKVDPKKKMLFNPKESIDLQGNTGPFIQYTHARIRSIWRKSGCTAVPAFTAPAEIHAKEKELIKLLAAFPTIIQEAAKELSPAVIANYTYELAKTFNQFYDACDVLKEADENLKNFRITLCVTVARTINEGMRLIGVEVPEKM